MKGEIRTQRIFIESNKNPLIPYVAKLEKSKDFYEKLVELFSVSTTGEFISLRIELYNMIVSKEEGVTSYLMRVSQIRNQLQELREIMYDKEITIVVLNALPDEGDNFV